MPESETALSPERNRALWESWQERLSARITLSEQLPPLRMLLVLDNLAGHKTPELVLWMFEHGVMPLYTPLGGSWLNMAESVQRILARRSLEGQHPKDARRVIEWLEATARGWNRKPTPFEWGGRRKARRDRARERRHALGGSGAYTHHPIRTHTTTPEERLCA
ncbi:MAG: transposase [Chloroflexota bacterium]|nr:transposase [Chloroflexota bacterium]